LYVTLHGKIIINLNLLKGGKMKTLGKLKLNQFSKDELDQRKLNALRGGCTCAERTCSGVCGNVCGDPYPTSDAKSDAYAYFNKNGASY